ncbi:hypothetical protein ASG31_05905 [Chryseobacterium sp. Leaf404]|uniref:hypothetical protein n=1 Tax=unclassified Chryseobacterium TaxID=2593645 RepID=UPI0007022E90|nr:MULTISPECIES: hypothetical protein [unclassified Chryseobacterium]KQT18260.1 hypothetical protein ASG31_05905 [Chryseobacterium sp. Leaf404]
MNKPNDEKEFLEWIKGELGFHIDDKYKYYFNTVVNKIKKDFEDSAFWTNLIGRLRELNDEYLLSKGVTLLIPENIPKIYTKSLDSLIIKAYRKNILNNKNFPDEPLGGWITPDNWFEKVSDIIRTTITVKYLDGVEFIINKLADFSKDNNLEFESSFEAREEGYYAAHSNLHFEFDIPDISFAATSKKMKIELQVTTQIQEIIKSLLHKHYEQNRKKEKPIDYKWQWDYKSEEFVPNYLGHIVHYVEGMIIEIRDKKDKI